MTAESVHLGRRRVFCCALLLLTLYPLSFGPACWVLMRIPHRAPPSGVHDIYLATGQFYDPLILLYSASPSRVQAGVRGYLELAAPAGCRMSAYPHGIVWEQPALSTTLLSLPAP
jgi:hypothetical protein